MGSFHGQTEHEQDKYYIRMETPSVCAASWQYSASGFWNGSHLTLDLNTIRHLLTCGTDGARLSDDNFYLSC